MEPLAGVDFIEGDFTEDEALATLEELLGGQAVDLVLSDMAPNMSGMSAVDQPRAMYLAELALAFAIQWLKPGGDFLGQSVPGRWFDAFLADAGKHLTGAGAQTGRFTPAQPRSVYTGAWPQSRVNWRLTAGQLQHPSTEIKQEIQMAGKKDEKPVNDLVKNLITWAIIAVVLMSIFNHYASVSGTADADVLLGLP